MRHTDQTIRRAFHALDAGESISATSRKLNVSRNQIYVWIANRKEMEARIKAIPAQERIRDDGLPPPLFGNEVPKEARRALEDFGYWRMRYLGRRSTPWQEEAANITVELLHSPETEMAVINEPPGSGKTTLFTHDLVAWMICRDRTIRILLGHRVQRIAMTYSERLRRTLARTRGLPQRGDRPATACLAQDYGRFKPTYNDAWRNEEFMVMMSLDEDNPDESGIEEKEPTVASFGMESEFLGTRANLVIWDDLVTGDILRSAEQIEKQQTWWEEEGQTRVEPGGALLLVGQRMGGDDLYAYALAQKREDTLEPRYKHIIFPAHDDVHCGGDKMHQKDSLAIGQGGCLLDPIRLPWYGNNGLLTIKSNTPAKYEIQYQQRDVARTEVLVPRVWVDGGRDQDGVDYPGCWDAFRSVGDVSAIRGLSAPWYSVVTADPSASNWWAIGWWILHPASNQAFLVDLHHDRMDGPDLLDWNANGGVFYGVLEDWAVRARKLGAPISHVIIETNACQRWLLQYDHTRRWQAYHGINVVPHTTGINKLDPQLGIQGVRDWFRHGRIRLPGNNDGSRHTVMPIVTEATRYEPAKPKARPDDCLMMLWFMTFHYAKLTKDWNRDPNRQPALAVPSWLAA